MSKYSQKSYPLSEVFIAMYFLAKQRIFRDEFNAAAGAMNGERTNSKGKGRNGRTKRMREVAS